MSESTCYNSKHAIGIYQVKNQQTAVLLFLIDFLESFKKEKKSK